MIKFIRNKVLFKLYETAYPYLKYSQHLEEKLPAKNVLVLAPHPDDEAIGCGGTIALHTADGGTATVLYATTDGEVRDKEAAAAAHLLGFSRRISLGYPVESLEKQNTLSARLMETFDEIKPEIVFIPFLMDNHTDHRGINKALIKAASIMRSDFLVYAYPVWLPLYPNVLIDIAKAGDIKRKAIECYASQTATRDYAAMTTALSHYWAHVKGHGLTSVESFFRLSVKEYAAFGEKIYG